MGGGGGVPWRFCSIKNRVLVLAFPVCANTNVVLARIVDSHDCFCYYNCLVFCFLLASSLVVFWLVKLFLFGLFSSLLFSVLLGE